MIMFGFIRNALTFHWLVTLLLMGVFGLIFGLSSANLFHLIVETLRYIANHGAMAVMEGALGQLFWLVFYGYLAVVAYVLIKACERALMDCIFARAEASPEPGLSAEPQTGAAPGGTAQ
jgi:hypothetical protein